MSEAEEKMIKNDDVQGIAHKSMSRKDFLRKGAFGLVGLIFTAKTLVLPTDAMTGAMARDNLGAGGGGVYVGDTAPSTKSKLWIDTSHAGRGVAKYWDGSKWSATASVWDE